MNKDVIYVEPENDITDIITKIENSPEKIVVLVPPKKAAVFRSVVNIKLIARAGRAAEKTVVLVTVDPSIIKLAAASRIPVTKDLKTPPEVPTLDEEPAEFTEEEIIEEEGPDGEVEEVVEKSVENSENNRGDKADEDDKEDEAEKEPETPPKKTKKAPKKSGNKIKDWILGHKIPVAIGGVVLVALVGFLIWAFNFAPAVTVGVEIQTETKSFAENVSFTTTASSENAKEGVFYIQEKKEESTQEIKFDATGKVNKGEKATGKATVYATVGGPYDDTVSIPSGTHVTIQGLGFTIQEGTTLTLEDDTPCEGSAASAAKNGCKVQGNVTVVANEPGEQYNLNWNNAQIGIGNATMSGSTSGGTNKEVKVVEQIDVEKAKDQIKASNEAEIKDKLLKSVGDDVMAIESSYSIETSNAEASPAVGQEVGDGVQPTLKVVTTAKIYTIDKSKLEEFIEEKANVPDDQKVYEVENPYIENFVADGTNFTGRLKASYELGPKVTDSEVVEMIKGKGLGEVQHDLKTINGVVNVTLDKSYPWVMSVPNDPNKITVNIDVRENGKNSENSAKNGSETSENNAENSQK